jgi:malonate transporter and related proteins
MLTLLLNALVPIFAGLLLGYVAGRRGLIDNKDIRSLVALAMNIAVPCALVSIIIETPRALLENQATTAIAIALVFIGLYAACYFWARQSLHMSIADSSVLALTIGFPNAAVALPLLSDTAVQAGMTFGFHAAVPAALSLAIGSITVSPVTLALLEAQRNSNGGAISFRTLFRSLPRAAVRPVVWAALLILACVALNVNFPSYLRGTLLMLANAAAGSALILTGVVVSAQRFRLEGSVLVASLAKLLLQPVLALGVTMLLHMSQHQILDVMVISAIPGGFFGLVFGSSFKATPEVVSSSLIASYALGWITLSMWLVVSARLS